MNRDELRLLIAKYEEAETTLEEEALLKKALSSADLSDEFKPYRDMFLLYEAASEVSMDKNYRADDFTPPLFPGWVFKLAAAIVIIASLLFVGQQFLPSTQNENINLYADTFDDPEQALAEAKKILSMVSEKMNKGTEAFAELDKLNQTQQKILKP